MVNSTTTRRLNGVGYVSFVWLASITSILLLFVDASFSIDNCDAKSPVGITKTEISDQTLLLTPAQAQAKCDVPEFFSCKEFAEKYWNKAPAIIRRPPSSEPFERFQHLSNKSELANNPLRIRLSTSVSYTGRVFKEMSVAEYMLDETPASKLGNETFYLFGNHEGDDWKRFLANYPRLRQEWHGRTVAFPVCLINLQ